jgi:hypothetical protein
MITYFIVQMDSNSKVSVVIRLSYFKYSQKHNIDFILERRNYYTLNDEQVGSLFGIVHVRDH